MSTTLHTEQERDTDSSVDDHPVDESPVTSPRSLVSRLLTGTERSLLWVMNFCVAAFIFLFAITVLVYTTETPNRGFDTSFIAFDPIWLTAPLVIALFVVLLAFDRSFEIGKWSLWRLLPWVVGAVFLASLTWSLMSGNTLKWDPEYVFTGAVEFSQGDFSALEPLNYLGTYPFQLGLALFHESFIFIFGLHAIDAIKIVYCVFVAVSIGLVSVITERVFKSRRASIYALILGALCLPAVMSSVHIYGNVPSGMFVLTAIALLTWSRTFRWWRMGAAVLAMWFAVTLRTNSLIAIIACGILLVLLALRERNWRYLVGVAGMALAVVVPTQTVTAIYEARSGQEIGPGVPSIAWVAMGLQNGPRGAGWYTGYSLDPYIESGGDVEATTEIAMRSLEHRIGVMVSDPVYATKFFAKKFTSQWADPSYQVFWAGAAFEDDPRSRLTVSAYSGSIHSVFRTFMDGYQSLVAIAAAVCIVHFRGRLTIEQLALGIIVMGGAAFHLFIWEAKSLYSLQYFLMLVPFAAAGLDVLARRLERHRERQQIGA